MKLSFSVLLVLFTVSAFAQRLKSFTPERQAYMVQLRDFLRETDVDKDEVLEPLLLDFSRVWDSTGLSDEEVEPVYKISNHFIKKRITSFEPWSHFLQLIIHIKNNEEENLLKPWLDDLQEFSGKSPARFTVDYLRTSYQVFYHNVLFDDGKSRWVVEGGFYEYHFEGEPLFKFDGVDIWGHYKNDSTIIEATSGIYYPHQYLFKGQGGNVYFTRAGLSQDSANAELSSFELNTSKTDFAADSVKLNTLVFLNEPTLGRYEEKLTSQGGKGIGTGTFPRFTSYDQNITIKDIVPGADYQGGFAMIGSKFYGGGTDSAKASFLFNYEGKPIIKAKSVRFLLRLDKIYSENVEVSVKIKDDSIYHPKATLRYLPDNQQLSIIRESKGLGQTAFTDTYHDMDIIFEILNWKMDSPKITLGNLNLGSESSVIFESQNYYRIQRFKDLQGLDSRNPLYKIREMVGVYGKKELNYKEVAQYLRMDPRNAQIFLMQMSILGFVSYNLTTRTATVKDKVYDYINNFEEKRDYDVIRFVSNLSQGNNATISLLDYAMEIEGVSAVALSDSQKVGLFPRGRKITVYEGLNFKFDGRITAGRFAYWGEQFEFNYEAFRINMENVDSMRFKVESFEENALGRRPLVDVRTVLQDLTGELLIDDPNNKSGQKVYTEYPIFRSVKDSYIYYDKPTIFSGVYDRTRFYVTLEPFEIDSLDNITTQGLKFDGTLTSAGIFPDLQQEIKVQEDYSLGFKTETPPNGLTAYGGKGTFTNQLSLSNRGLRGDGQIDYLNSVASSDEFFFFPDSTDGLALTYEITSQVAGPSTPHVTGSSVDLHWEPYNDVLYTTSKETPFAMYDDIGMTAKGTLAHSPSSLKGKGLLEFLNAETRSKDYLFENRRFSSPELAFRVRANPEAEWGFGLENARGEVDFNKQKGDFYLNDPADYFSFPANKYICYMDYAKWSIPEKAIDVKKVGSQASSLMVSVLPKQDSLQFEAGFTKFYLENSLLESFKVPNINVADASIFPDTGYVAIEENAKMRTLNNAAITANRTTEYHAFYGGVINIRSRNYYSGLADYEYLDQDGTPWPVRFETIRVDTGGTTIGKANVSQEEGFYMSPYFAYYGRINLRADRLELEFKGYTHIETQCPSVETDWFAFHSIVDPNSIVIDLPEIDPEDRTKNLNNGVYLAADTVGGYAAFLSKRISPADKEMFWANGKLFFDELIGSYVITSEERLNDSKAKGNYLAFNSTLCTMTGKGAMSLGDGRSQMEINSFGVINYNLENDNMDMDLVMGLDFFFSDDILEQMAKTINGEAELEGSNLGREAFKEAANQLLKEKERDRFLSDIENYGAPEKLPDEFINTILFSDVNLKWTPEAISFLSDGKLGIGSLGKYQVNKKLEGYLEIQRKRRGDEIYLYLEVDRSTFYYFEYKRNILNVYSSDDILMDIIKNKDIDDRKNQEKGLPTFTYTIGTKGKMRRFLSRMENL